MMSCLCGVSESLSFLDSSGTVGRPGVIHWRWTKYKKEEESNPIFNVQCKVCLFFIYLLNRRLFFLNLVLPMIVSGKSGMKPSQPFTVNVLLLLQMTVTHDCCDNCLKGTSEWLLNIQRYSLAVCMCCLSSPAGYLFLVHGLPAEYVHVFSLSMIIL